MLKAVSSDRSRKIKVILALAVPSMIENFLQTIVGFVDTLFVSRIGLNEVAAVGVTNAIMAVYIAVFMAMGVGTSSLIARSVGAGEIHKAKAIARQSTWISALLGLAFGIITLFFAEPLLRLMGAEPHVLADSVVYFRIVAVPSIFISLMTVFGSILRAAGDTKTPMKVGLWINMVHIALDYVLIFGLFGWAGWGIAGAAWATSAVRVIGSVALFIYIRKSKLSFSIRKGASNEYALPLLKLSAPAAAERLIMRFGQVLYFGLIVRIGTDVYAAHILAGNIEIFSYMPGYGLAVAATTLVGQHLGANRKEDAYQYGLLTMWIAVVFMAFAGILLFVFSPIAANWFTKDAAVIKMVTTALRIDAFAQPFLAIGLVIAGALQGAGDTKSPMYSTAIGMWLVRVVGVYVLCLHFDMGIAGIWISIAIDLIIRAAYLTLRFYRKMRSAPA
ncbi:MATE family efflux transporter [Paenibacillus rhizophilus]|uniref:Probable multidrug resistance protein NorM n=1 Tax=Paenibacillus rhizophilus TaxID=1850366 RepID=A0A3N9PXM3_9BACL|nr:MATE family efflux transporter [Paenibacillus rhizophilus]RQW11142.1 MATE family efflux transporter [Paenibacillus rhizophilus]